MSAAQSVPSVARRVSGSVCTVLPARVRRKAAAAADLQEMLVSRRVAEVQRTEVTRPVPRQCGARVGVIAVDHGAGPAHSFRTAEAAADTSFRFGLIHSALVFRSNYGCLARTVRAAEGDVRRPVPVRGLGKLTHAGAIGIPLIRSSTPALLSVAFYKYDRA